MFGSQQAAKNVAKRQASNEVMKADLDEHHFASVFVKSGEPHFTADTTTLEDCENICSLVSCGNSSDRAGLRSSWKRDRGG